MTTSTLAQQFFNLFRGLDRAHGRYSTPKVNGTSAKLEAGAGTVAEPVTVELWEVHLAGGMGLGITPVMDDANVWFGCIDIDVYPLEHKILNEKIQLLGLPLVVTRTKSGGAHCYLFCSEPTSAALVQGRLMEWAVLLGFTGVEVFPKQVKLANNKDNGSWLNMPYFDNNKRTTRYGFDDKGEPLNASGYLTYANSKKISAYELQELKIKASLDDIDDWFEESPPCLSTLGRTGYPEGSRNNGLFAIAVYLRKRFGEESWEDRLDTYNNKFMLPPLGYKEVVQIIKSVKKKSYSYKCKDQPIVGVCNKQLCLLRKFGIKGANEDPGVKVGSIQMLMTEPVTWLIDVNSHRIELTTEELHSFRKFQLRCMETLAILPEQIKQTTWEKVLKDRLPTAERIHVPEDATREGQLWVHLSKFCTSRVTGKALDELLIGRPYTDKERSYFCANDFLQYLTQQRVHGVSERELWRWLRRRKATHHDNNLKGKHIHYWSVPAFQAQTQEFDIPRVDPLEVN